jgi:uncharacterized protein (DUF1800 family)
MWQRATGFDRTGIKTWCAGGWVFLFSAMTVGAADAAWTPADAAHLLRRAGFGGTPQQIDYLHGLGKAAAVDYLVDYDAIPYDAPEFELPPAIGKAMRKAMRDFDEEGKKRVRNFTRGVQRMVLQDMRSWWLQRMVETPRPLEEKMTLFWHGHLTSGAQEIKRTPLLYVQNDFLRTHAMADFRTILLGISKDPAMILYLNNQQNKKESPNENYARELMELFSLGEGNYTEKDIKEAARALTGWMVGPGDQFVFNRGQHDNGEKTFLGKTGNFDGEDIIDIIMTQPATSRYIAGKLWAFFAYDNPSEKVVDQIAAVMRKNKFSTRETMRAVLNHDAFYSDEAKFTQIKSPVEMLVSSFRTLDVAPTDFPAMAAACKAMGQDLFQPPNVKGWDGGRKWITSSTLFERYNTAGALVFGTGANPRAKGPGNSKQAAMVNGRMRDRMMQRITKDDLAALPAMDEIREFVGTPQVFSSPQKPFNPNPIVRGQKLDSAEKLVDHFVARLVQRPISPDRRTELVERMQMAVGENMAASPESLQAIRTLIHLIMSTPEYQLG